MRVNIHEGRKLTGGNIHPVCNVHVGKQSKHTRVQKSTTKPLWDEVSWLGFISIPSKCFRRKHFLLFPIHSFTIFPDIISIFQVLFYDFNCSALDLCDEPVTIEVLNSRKIRSDSLIGAFKFDLGLVYESTGKSDWLKWWSDKLSDHSDQLSEIIVASYVDNSRQVTVQY